MKIKLISENAMIKLRDFLGINNGKLSFNDINLSKDSLDIKEGSPEESLEDVLNETNLVKAIKAFIVDNQLDIEKIRARGKRALTSAGDKYSKYYYLNHQSLNKMKGIKELGDLGLIILGCAYAKNNLDGVRSEEIVDPESIRIDTSNISSELVTNLVAFDEGLADMYEISQHAFCDKNLIKTFGNELGKKLVGALIVGEQNAMRKELEKNAEKKKKIYQKLGYRIDSSVIDHIIPDYDYRTIRNEKRQLPESRLKEHHNNYYYYLGLNAIIMKSALFQEWKKGTLAKKESGKNEVGYHYDIDLSIVDKYYRLLNNSRYYKAEFHGWRDIHEEMNLIDNFNDEDFKGVLYRCFTRIRDNVVERDTHNDERIKTLLSKTYHALTTDDERCRFIYDCYVGKYKELVDKTICSFTDLMSHLGISLGHEFYERKLDTLSEEEKRNAALYFYAGALEDGIKPGENHIRKDKDGIYYTYVAPGELTYSNYLDRLRAAERCMSYYNEYNSAMEKPMTWVGSGKDAVYERPTYISLRDNDSLEDSCSIITHLALLCNDSGICSTCRDQKKDFRVININDIAKTIDSYELFNIKPENLSHPRDIHRLAKTRKEELANTRTDKKTS